MKPILSLLHIAIASVCAFATIDVSAGPTAAEGVTTRWATRINGTANADDAHNGVAFDAAGNVFSCGAVFNSGTGRDFQVVKYDKTTGAVLWTFTKQGASASSQNVTDRAVVVAVAPGGAIYAAGNVTGVGRVATFSDWYLVKLDPANGQVIWERGYSGPGDGTDTIVHLAVDSNGNVVLVGYLQESSGGQTVKKVDSLGATVWTTKIVNVVGQGEQKNASLTRAAFDSQGNAIVSGSAAFWDLGYESYVTKLGSSDGARAWEWHGGYTGSSSGGNGGGVAVDGADNVVTSATLFETYPHLGGTGADLLVAKINGATGAELWRNAYDGPSTYPSTKSEIAGNVALSPNGDVVVIGSSKSASDIFDIATRKLNGTTGAEQWTKRYVGVSDCFGWGIATTATGDVLALGYGAIAGQGQNARLIKYAGADGAIVWETFYNGPANGDENFQQMSTLAVGPGGTVVIAPSSYGDGLDWATVLLVTAPLDTDGDGLPDAWETANGLNLASGADAALDADGDGLINLHEYLAGTDPQSAASVFRVESVTATGAGGAQVIAFNATADHSYTVLYRTNLTSGPWLKVADVATSPNAAPVNVTDSGSVGESNRFYRITTPAQIP
jgi:hypothetical protein